MKTISIRLEDSIYEEPSEMLDAMGQTKQTFYETFTRTALRQRSIPFIIKAPLSDTHANSTMRENDYDSIIKRVENSFKDKQYLRRISGSRQRWIDEDIGIITSGIVTWLKTIK